MALFGWEARTSSGQTVRGELEAVSRDSVEQTLRSQRLTVTRIEQIDGAIRTGAADRVPSPGARGFFRDRLWLVGVLAVSTAVSAGVAFISPVQSYDCVRQANGSVDCTVHRRMWGLVPRADVRVPGVSSVDVRERQTSRPKSSGSRRKTSYSALQLTQVDGTVWESPETSWPMGRTAHELADGVRSLLEARAQTYRGRTAETVTLLVSAAFLVPHALVLLVLVLRRFLLSR